MFHALKIWKMGLNRKDPLVTFSPTTFPFAGGSQSHKLGRARRVNENVRVVASFSFSAGSYIVYEFMVVPLLAPDNLESSLEQVFERREERIPFYFLINKRQE